MGKIFCVVNAMSLIFRGDHVENVLWLAISLLLPLSVQNIVVQFDSPRDITDCIDDVGTVFWGKFNMANIIICGLISRDECCLVNRL